MSFPRPPCHSSPAFSGRGDVGRNDKKKETKGRIAIRPYGACLRGLFIKIRVGNKEGEHKGSPLH